MESYNIVFASDHGYLPHMSVAIASLIENNSEVSLNIYVINSDIRSDEWANLLDLDLRKKHTFINAQINDDELTDLITNHHFTKANYYRLFIDEIVPDDKALYIDSDVVINGRLEELWNTNISEVYLAAVEEPNFFLRHHDLEMSLDSKYFNSGVMLLNLDMWRKNAIRKRVLEFVRRKPNVIQFVDQCGLNSVVNGEWLRIHPKYNMQTAILEMQNEDRQSFYDFHNIDEALKAPVIIHFTGSSKPWHFLNNHPYKKKYWEYLKKTKYKRILPADFTFKKFIFWCLPHSFINIPRKILRKVRFDK